MKRNFLVLIISFLFINLNAQNIPSKFRITFNDKDNSQYSIADPSQFLSSKALERRSKMNIPIKANDLPVNKWYIDSIRKTGAEVLTISKWFNCITVYTKDKAVLEKIITYPFVASIDTLAESSAKAGGKPIKKNISATGIKSLTNDESNEKSNDYYITQGELNKLYDSTVNKYNYGYAYNQVHMLSTDYLHNLGYNGKDITIAVLDAGFYKVDSLAVFDSLRLNNQLLGNKDFVDPGGNVFARSTHGMMVLSIMGGNLPSQIIGTAPKANYWLLRSEDGDSEYLVEEDNWVCAAEFADSVGADIINSSLGYTTFFNPYMDHTYQDMNGDKTRVTQGADIAASKGMIVVNSAGNSGNNSWHFIGAPADADSIVTVGSVNSEGKVSDFSSRGPAVDGRIKPTVCAMGEGTFVANTTGSVMSGNGTSFSSPVIAGSIACLWQANYQFSNMKIIEALIASSSRYYSPDSLFGYGIPNFVAANLLLNGVKIQNFEEDNSINVFPNPFIDGFNIVFYSSDTSAIDLQMFDVTGRMVLKIEKIGRTPGCNYIPVSGLNELSNGYYMLKVFSGNNVYSVKIFKAL